MLARRGDYKFILERELQNTCYKSSVQNNHTIAREPLRLGSVRAIVS